MCRAVVPQMVEQGGGAIVNISSINGIRTLPALAGAYGASKLGMVALTREIAIEFAPKGIRCNALLPGMMRTPFVEASLTAAWGGDVEDMWRQRTRLIPIGRQGESWSVAHAALFLASDDARYVTGCGPGGRRRADGRSSERVLIDRPAPADCRIQSVTARARLSYEDVVRNSKQVYWLQILETRTQSRRRPWIHPVDVRLTRRNSSGRAHHRIPGRSGAEAALTRPHAQRHRLVERTLHAVRRRQPPSPGARYRIRRTSPASRPWFIDTSTSSVGMSSPSSTLSRAENSGLCVKPIPNRFLQCPMSLHRFARTHGPIVHVPRREAGPLGGGEGTCDRERRRARSRSRTLLRRDRGCAREWLRRTRG